MWIILAFIIIANLVLRHYFPPVQKPQVNKKYDIAIVLGSPAKDDGSLSRMQKTRVDAAIRLYQNKKVKKILISGSNVVNDYVEAEVMAAYAIDKGIPASDIYLEIKARNTFENLKFAKNICNQTNIKDVIVVTSNFHARRAQFMVRKFFTSFAMKKTKEKEKFKHYIMEYFRMWNSLYYEIKLKRQ